MKKALSVLLVAAALFGFYGSAVTVNDLLACKDYWEEAGEKSTADMNKLEDGLNQLKDNEEAYLDGIDQVAEGEKTLAQGEADYAAAPGKLAAARSALASGEKQLAAGKKTLDAGKDMLKQLKAGVKELSDQEKGFPAWKAGRLQAEQNPAAAAFMTDGSLDETKINAQKSALEQKKAALSGYKTQYDKAKKTLEDLKDYPDSAVIGQAEDGSPITAGAARAQAQGGVDQLDATAQGMAAQQGMQGVDTFDDLWNTIVGGIDSCNNLLKLTAGKKQMQDKLLPLLDKVKDNKDFIKALGGKAKVKDLLTYLNGSDMEFMGAMDQIMKKAPELVSMVSKAVNKGQKDYNAGKNKLASGRAQYADGLASYEAAPAQLEAGRQALADGKSQLAAYEDGEQQIRDGLATLFNTEADLDLVSIADRLNGDGDFDNGDNHLEIEEGLNAVTVGREYQGEDGVLITKEIMGRAVATGGLIGAAVLAVLAAILSFLKKNKAAGVFALLAAAAGAFGAFYGPAQGTYFSDIAGSTIGTTTWVAAGVLGAVALVHAIAHFAAPKTVA